MARTETTRQALQRVQGAIARGHRLGVCDSEGNSVTRSDGTYVAKPRVCRPTHKWVKGVGWVSLL